jgi:hypothetical protein
MMRPNPFLLLINAFDFSVSDLYANRRGELSPRQHQLLEQQRLHELELCTLGLIALIVGGAVLEIRLIVIVFGASCLVSVMLAVNLRYNEDKQGPVQTVSGRLQFKAAAGLPLHPHYHLLIDSEDFLVSNPVKQAFDSTLRYRLYYTPGSLTIVSAEVAA